jgi:hypothetical protein
MIIKQTRIRNLDRHLAGISPGDTLVFALRDLPLHHPRIEQAGFHIPLTSGDAVLPRARGPISRFNAEGKYIIHRDRPKETVYHQRELHWVEWHGQERIEQTGIKDIPYERYPRTFVPPPSVEFKIATTTSGDLILVSAQQAYSEVTAAACMHTINLLLEYFGECHVLNTDLQSIINVPVIKLNWHILPEGVRPWESLEPLLKGVIPGFESNKNKVFRNNLAFINSFKPTFAAVGRAGFSGYVVFGFPSKNIYVCESVFINNATYIFDANWEVLSQMTKAEILNQSWQKGRIIHTPEWHSKMRTLLR